MVIILLVFYFKPYNGIFFFFFIVEVLEITERRGLVFIKSCHLKLMSRVTFDGRESLPSVLTECSSEREVSDFKVDNKYPIR